MVHVCLWSLLSPSPTTCNLSKIFIWRNYHKAQTFWKYAIYKVKVVHNPTTTKARFNWTLPQDTLDVSRSAWTMGNFPPGQCHTLVPPWLTALLPSAQILTHHGVDRCWINMGVTNATTASVTASVMKKNDRLHKHAHVWTQTHEAAKHGNRPLNRVHTEVGRAACHLSAITISMATDILSILSIENIKPWGR